MPFRSAAAIRVWGLSILALLLSATPAQAKERLAVIEFSAKAGLSQDVADALADLVANTIRNLGSYEVIGKSDIQSIIGFERIKHRLGCDEISCLAEIGGALGVKYIVAGNVTKLGTAFLLNLRLIDSKRAVVVHGVSESYSGGDEILLKVVPPAVGKLFRAKVAAPRIEGVVLETPASDRVPHSRARVFPIRWVISNNPQAESQRVACSAGQVSECALLAKRFASGNGVPKNSARSKELLSYACEAHIADACLKVGMLWRGDSAGAFNERKASRYFEKACNAGEAVGCFEAGALLYNGIAGNRDLPRARELFESACQMGDNDGCMNVAMMCRDAEGGPKDLPGARGWYAKGCARRSADACAALALMFEQGWGGPAQPELARQHFKIACKLGHEGACRLVNEE